MSPNAAESSSQGIDAGKVEDRKRHIAFGVLGTAVGGGGRRGYGGIKVKVVGARPGQKGVHAATETVDVATRIRKRAYESNAP
jgi:hypothetical protein